MKKVQSSNIDTIHYDPETQVLEVQFLNGGLYHYKNVSQADYNHFEKAESVGGHFHKHIRSKYQSEKKK